MIDLQDPKVIAVDGATRNLLSQVSTALDELSVHRPFTPDTQARLRSSLLPDRIVASLNMEGIVATRRQTLDVMDAIRIKESVDKGKQEIYNALKADEFVCDAVEQGTTVSALFIREINKLLLDGVHPEAGLFRHRSVELPGAPFPPPNPADIPPLVARLCDLFGVSEAQHPIIQAAWLHEQVTLIHPFMDGNGRTGRLLQDYILIRRGLLPVGIPPSQRDDYYAALAAADKAKWNDLVEMIALLELSTITKTIAIAKEPERRKAWIQQLSSIAASKRENTLHKQYLVWRQRMEGLSTAFAQAVAELDETSDQLGAEIKQFSVPDFTEWKRICQFGYTERNWLFSIVFFADRKPFYKSIALFQRHESRPSVDPFAYERDLVGLYFTGIPAHSFDRPAYRDYSDPHIRLRELLFFGDTIYRYTQPAADQGWQVDTVPAIEQVVEDFFKDVFLRKAGLGA